MADRPVGLRDVLVLAGACVVVVLGAAILTSFLPADAQGVVFKTPLLIVVLIVGTGAALWRIARPRRDAADRSTTPALRATGAAVGVTGQAAADARRRAFAALSDGALDLVVIGGGIVGCGALLDATSRGLRAALVERDDLAVGHLEQIVEADPRRAPVPRAIPVRAGPGGAGRAGPDPQAGTAPRPGRAVPVPPVRQTGRHPRLLRVGHDAVRPVRREPRRRTASPSVGRGDDRPRARAASTAAPGRAGVPRRRARRRPLCPGGRADGRDRRRRRRDASGRGGAGRGERPRHGPPRPRSRERRPGRGPRPGDRRCHRRLGGRSRVTAERRLDAAAAQSGLACHRPPRTHPERHRADDPRPGQGRVPRAVAPPLDHRHDGRAVRRPDRPAGRERRRGAGAARRGEPVDRRRPPARRPRRDVLRRATADRPVRRARRSPRRASTRSPPSRMASSGSPAASSRRTGSWPGTRSTPRSACSARTPRRGRPARPT